MMACPYKARSFVHEPHTDQNPEVPRGQGCVEGCTLCVHRVDRGGTPACVEACAAAGHNAMLFGDLNDPESAISKRIREVKTTQVRADLKLDLGVRYEGIRLMRMEFLRQLQIPPTPLLQRGASLGSPLCKRGVRGDFSGRRHRNDAQ
jgi:Fe-S-cluster-containing dehydrogenase component